MTLRVLLAAPESEFAQFLREVLVELDGARCWGDWVHLEASYGPTWSDAAVRLASGVVDVLLLDPDLPDSQGAETFRRAQAIAPRVPIILLVESASARVAERMVRDGAQDFLLKAEVDCAPLARAVRNALDRHRLLTAARATAMTDSLTGLLSGPAFLRLADRDRRLAGQLNRRLLVVVAETVTGEICRDGGSADAQRRDLALVEAADALRSLTDPTGLIARLDDSRFGLAMWDTDAESLENIRVRLATASFRVGAAVFDPQNPVTLESLLDRATDELMCGAGL